MDTQPLKLSVTIPGNMTANIAVPPTGAACTPLLDGQPAKVTAQSGVNWINAVGSGAHVIGCQ